ncbi:MAG: hypothetical protein NVV82_09865 [Sporocytophaga sp.]|nr:hypothetical protein [Sporocytophaga sp.]
MKVPVPVYGEVPPVAVIVAVPLEAPLQSASVCVSLIERTVGSPITTDTVEEHPFASVTAKECVPAASPLKVPVPV